MTQIRRPERVSVFGALQISPLDHHAGQRTSLIQRRKRRRPFNHDLIQFSVVVCCFGSLILILGSLVLFFPFSSEYWRSSHHTNPEIQKLQQKFPIHVNGDMERIQHPGFQLADPTRLAAVLSGVEVSKDINVPKFWDPPAYGGVREFLGNSGEYLVTKEEASAIGSKYSGKETIFVAVVSYRDPECRATVEDIFQRAKYPERIRVAVVDQRTPGDEDPVCGPPVKPCDEGPEQVFCKYTHLIDYLEYEAQLMVGPTFARHLGYRMYRGEYFAMQVDSHVRFVANWDVDIIDQWKSTGNEMALLSTYLSDIINSIDPKTHESLRQRRSVMCNAEFEWKGDSTEHIKYNIQPTNEPRIQSSPMLHPFWAAGFSFGRGHFVVTVPYDPWLPLVFQGEEISMTVRAFTHGYDFYAPVRNVAFHIYATRENTERRSNVKTFTENASLFPGAKEGAYHRLNGIIGAGRPSIIFNRSDEKIYGLGGARTAEMFYRTFGIHLDRSEMEKGLCDFVQGVGGYTSMHQEFSPFLRYNGMGIDYSRISFEYKDKARVDSPIDPEELASLRESLRRRQTSQL